MPTTFSVARMRSLDVAHHPRQLREDLLDLLALFDRELLALVAELDDGRGLDEERRAGRAGIVHDPRELPPVLGLDRGCSSGRCGW